MHAKNLSRRRETVKENEDKTYILADGLLVGLMNDRANHQNQGNRQNYLPRL